MSHLNRLLLWIGLFMLALRVPAQLTVSTIRGTATDPSGSAVSGANITLVNLGTNIQRMVVTNENGDFEIPDLQRGTYRLTTSHAGFKNWVADNIILESNQIRRIDVTLELGAVGAEVTVRAEAAVISTASAKIQSTFTNKAFRRRPAGGRRAQSPNGADYASACPKAQAASTESRSRDSLPVRFRKALKATPASTCTSIVKSRWCRAITRLSFLGYFNLITKSGSNQLHGRVT